MTETNAVSTDYAIQLEGLSKSFGYNLAIRNIDLQVKPGERLSVIGPNGAGKTTLLKIIATIIQPSSGKVVIDGMDASKYSSRIRHKIGIITHQSYLYGSLTAYENLDFYCRMYGLPESKKRIEAVTDMVGASDRLHDRVSTLSRGIQQRFSIARALLHEPEIMLMDEPETGLDQHVLPLLSQICSGQHGKQSTVVLTTHNLERALQIGDSIAIICRGNIVFKARTDSLDITGLKNAYGDCTGAEN